MAGTGKPKFEIQIIDFSRVSKYAVRTLNRQDGLFYADLDFNSSGRVKPGALPDRMQDTEEKCALAKQLHEVAATRQMQEILGIKPEPHAQPNGLLARARRWFARPRKAPNN